MDKAAVITASTEGARVAVRLTPGASRAAIEGPALDAAGRAFLRVRVTEPPEGGKANRALVRLLAREWKLPKTSLEIVAGHRDRIKTVAVAGEPGIVAHLKQHIGSNS